MVRSEKRFSPLSPLPRRLATSRIETKVWGMGIQQPWSDFVKDEANFGNSRAICAHGIQLKKVSPLLVIGKKRKSCAAVGEPIESVEPFCFVIIFIEFFCFFVEDLW